jgi:opine dehydrogenase
MKKNKYRRRMEKLERILVMGGGPAGIAAAAALSQRGYHVALYNLPKFQSTLEPLIKVGGVEIEGSLGEEFVFISVITTDIQKAMRDVQLVLIGVPGYGQRPMVETCLPYIKTGITILLMPGSCGSLEVAPIITKAGNSLDDVLLGETVTMPVSARMVGEAKIRIRLPSTDRVAAFPGRNTSRLVESLGDAFQLIAKPNVLDPGINNPNFLIHPAPMLLNYAAVERAEGLLSIMNEGMTEGVLRLLDAVDAEKMALQRALGLDVVPIDDLYRESGSGPEVYRKKGEPFGLHDRIHDRYIREDVPYGMVLYSSIGDILDVPTPLCDGITSILSAVEQTDYWAIGRTKEKMGLAGLDRDGLLYYVETGERS